MQINVIFWNWKAVWHLVSNNIFLSLRAWSLALRFQYSEKCSLVCCQCHRTTLIAWLTCFAVKTGLWMYGIWCTSHRRTFMSWPTTCVIRQMDLPNTTSFLSSLWSSILPIPSSQVVHTQHTETMICCRNYIQSSSNRQWTTDSKCLV